MGSHRGGISAHRQLTIRDHHSMSMEVSAHARKVLLHSTLFIISTTPVQASELLKHDFVVMGGMNKISSVNHLREANITVFVAGASVTSNF